MLFFSKTLRYFMAVAQHSSITRAADFLCITPSPLSKNIQILESNIGFALFIRDNQGLHLTGKGRLLHQRLAPYYKEILEIEQSLNVFQTEEYTRLAIGTNGTYSGFISNFYNKLKSLNEEYTLSMHIIDDEDKAKKLACGDIHLYISSEPNLSAPNIISHHMADEPLRLAISSYLLDKYNNNIVDLMFYCSWAQPQYAYFQRIPMLSSYLKKLGINPDIICLNDLSQRLSLVEQGKAISLVPLSLKREIAKRNIKMIELPGERLYLPWHLYYMEESYTALGERIALLLECFKQNITDCIENQNELDRHIDALKMHL